jgi:hypothetical protein
MPAVDATGGVSRAVRIVGSWPGARAGGSGRVVAVRGRRATLAAMSASSDQAVLSSIGTQVDDLARRVTELAEAYGTTPDSAIAAELYAVERSLNTATRSLDRATRLLGDLT